VTKRLFWLLFGIVLGVYAVTRLKSRARRLGPGGMSNAVDKVADAVRDFGEEVRAGMDQRESELREALGLDTDGRVQGNTEKAEYGDR
jgi:chromosome condensin MukBEF MukE localization factor